MPKKIRELRLADCREYQKTHKAQIAARKKGYWRTPKFVVINFAEREVARKKRIQYCIDYRERVKREVFVAYGGAFCKCCSESIMDFLTIDHENGGGQKDRDAGLRGFGLYLRLRKDGFPPGYQVLCFNCNCGRAINGGICPHQAAKLTLVSA